MTRLEKSIIQFHCRLDIYYRPDISTISHNAHVRCKEI